MTREWINWMNPPVEKMRGMAVEPGPKSPARNRSEDPAKCARSERFLQNDKQ